MRPSVKLVAIALITSLCAWAAFAYFGNDEADCTVVLTGEITPDTFFSNKECLITSQAKNKRVIARNSDGGNWESSLALGTLIHRHGWDVEVQGYCASSCAIFVLPAGRVKYLHSDSLPIFHGGPHQANLREQYEAADRANAALAAGTLTGPVQVQVPGREKKEGSATYDPGGSEARRRVRQFLGIPDAATEVGTMLNLVEASDRYYADLGLDVHLGTYGQIGRYESTYQAYKSFGFWYPLDSLRRLGVNNIEVMGGEWHPERNPEFPALYEVTYP